MGKEHYVIGIDFGTASVRALLVNALTGEEIAVSEFEYPRWKKGMYCDPSKNQFRQHPLDYLEGLEHTLRDVVQKGGKDIAENVKAISVDTTGSTPVAVDETGMPLALKEEFTENPNAMFFLWKDHTAIQEAEEINQNAKKFKQDYLKYSGGMYSSEWFWAKLLYALRHDEAVAKACRSWVEHCDWIPFLLTGGKDVKKIKRGVCAAGHKALWAEEHGGLPEAAFFLKFDSALGKLDHPLFTKTFSTDSIAGDLCPEWAKKLGLSTNVSVGIGILDAHAGSVGGQIAPYYLSKVIGTSTCDMLVAPISDKLKVIQGISGQVTGSIIPGMIGLEAGQSAFGDAYAWFEKLLTETVRTAIEESAVDVEAKTVLLKEIDSNILNRLGKQAAKLPIDVHSELAVDWFNGRRTPNVNPYVKGAFLNLDLGSNAASMYGALVEATCFGSKQIVDHFVANGIPLKGIIALGGVARKSDYVMQTMADVLGLTIKVHKSEQTCATGAAMFASVIAGIHSNVEEAMRVMGQGFDAVYQPNKKNTELYSKRYTMYRTTGDFLEKKIN
ncbi:ribulokinase [Flagellimonas sp. HMM57]|uniref:ribulokinase n=1 Tax=unclassified Flagellimonas TaxID=2644544 RepID=UPI0013D737EC|nr:MULTISPECIES: ribulokinase [unclassified Flagellimonas]UII75398.1 ribulokinase [Flagellimonas sp. HMM57]